MTFLCLVSLFLSLKDTTRPRKSHEKEGVEYHFVSKQAFEADLHHNKYVDVMARLASARWGSVRVSTGPLDLMGGLSGEMGEAGENLWWKVPPSFRACLDKLRN